MFDIPGTLVLVVLIVLGAWLVRRAWDRGQTMTLDQLVACALA